MIEPTRQVPENPLSLLGGRTVPSLTQYLLDSGMQRRVEPLEEDVPLERLIAMVLDAGYDGLFDLELLGPRIDAEGSLSATRRSVERMTEMLDRLGA